MVAVGNALAGVPPRRSGSVEQTTPLATPPPPRSEWPIIGLPALLQLVDWLHSRRQNAQQGGPSCVHTGQSLSPPAPDHGGRPTGPPPPLADSPRRAPRA